jgi:F0F1-type ATP synthase assembly protein I
MPFIRPNPNRKPAAKPVNALASLVEAEKMMQIAILLPSAAFVGWLLGLGADHLLHQSWISLVGIIFGGVSGLVYVVRLVVTTGAKPGTGKGSPETKP